MAQADSWSIPPWLSLCLSWLNLCLSNQSIYGTTFTVLIFVVYFIVVLFFEQPSQNCWTLTLWGNIMVVHIITFSGEFWFKDSGGLSVFIWTGYKHTTGIFNICIYWYGYLNQYYSYLFSIRHEICMKLWHGVYGVIGGSNAYILMGCHTTLIYI